MPQTPHLISEGSHQLRVMDYERRYSLAERPYFRCTLRIEDDSQEAGRLISWYVFGIESAARLAAACGIAPMPYDDSERLVRKCLNLPLCGNVKHRSDYDGKQLYHHLVSLRID